MANASPTRVCSIHSCDAPHVGRGWCAKHYRRWRIYGDPHFVKVVRREVPLPPTTYYLKPGEVVPPGLPRRYVNVHGYVILRWKVGVRAYIETLEHRVVNGRVTTAPHVHHADRCKTNNSPGNLVHLDASTHAQVHNHKRIDRAEAARLYESGLSTTQVAKALGTHAGNVSRMIREQGVTPRPRAPRNPDLDREAVAAAYADGWPNWQIRETFGVTDGVIRACAKENGIPMRSPSDPARLAGR